MSGRILALIASALEYPRLRRRFVLSPYPADLIGRFPSIVEAGLRLLHRCPSRPSTQPARVCGAAPDRLGRDSLSVWASSLGRAVGPVYTTVNVAITLLCTQACSHSSYPNISVLQP